MHRVLTIAYVLRCALLWATPTVAELPSHEIVPATAEAKRNGEAAFIPLKDGSLLLLYGSHSNPGDWDRGEIRQIRSRDGGKTWSQPETVFSDPKRSFFQCALARLPSGDIGLTHTSLAHGQDAIKVFRRSSDDGHTWSEPIVISDKEYAYTTGPWDKLYVLESGRLIAILHCNLKPDAKKQGGSLGSYTVSSDDDGETWKRSPAADVLHVADNPHKGKGRGHEWGFWEPGLVEHAPGKLLMLGRTTTGWLWESRSADNGTTWSAPVKTAVPNPVAPPVLTRVPGTDTLVLIQNPDVDMKSGWHGGPRRALAFRTSTDAGRTWSEPTDLYRASEEGLWVDYPAIRWIDGNLHMVWRHIRGGGPGAEGSMTGLYHHVVPAALLAPTSATTAALEADVCVYGATSGGVAAAVQAARMGKRVVLIEPGRHVGGMTSGGLSAVDIGDPRTIGGITREFFTRLVARYGTKLAWDEPHKAVGGSGGGTGGAYAIEPHVADEVFEELVKEAGVPVLRDARLLEVAKEGPRIDRIVVAGPNGARRAIVAKMFIDTTYEGDLMAAAGVSHTLTRESRDQYGESLAGIAYTPKYRPRKPHEQPGPSGRTSSGQGVWDRDFPLDPYVIKGDPASGLLPLVNAGEPGEPGAAAPGVQAYCFRLCLTTAADRLPIDPPPGYDPARYEILVRFIEACLANGDDMDLRWFSKHDPVPNQKYDFNTATFGGNLPGASRAWCEADHEARQQLLLEQEHYHRGLLHFLATDPRVPVKVRNDMQRFGLPRDEFPETGGWPHQLYIREGRRMIGELVMTQHHTFGKQVAADPVSLGSYGTDCHEIRRIVKDGVVTREGKLGEGRGGAGPYGIGYRAILPKRAECDNLLVTFALSASHVAFASIRMEPVFMVTSQSAAAAAALAIDADCPLHAINTAALRARLLADGQVLP
jgi:hypothetical protein